MGAPSWMVGSRAAVRVLKKRAVLGAILVLSFLYCLHSIISTLQTEQIVEVDEKPALHPELPFRWQSDLETTNDSHPKPITCRNSVQGKVLITDDRGYVCPRGNVLPSGCCDVSSVKTKRYSCDTCLAGGCCSIYEHCISCCLQPDKKLLLQSVLGKATETFSVLFASVTDHFELCLAKCRTSSQSVQHENSYRDPKAKHCYGDSPPTLQQGMT